MAPPVSRKKSLGRQKIDMKYIEDETSRMVTFSKRRAGIFKKATELSVVCGAQLALVIFSICGRAYSFGHPNLDSVINRFLKRSHVPTMQDSAEGRRLHAERINELREKCEKGNEELEKTKKRVKELEDSLEGSPFLTSEESLGKLSVDQLKGMKMMMEDLRESIVLQMIAGKSKNVAAAPEVQEEAGVDYVSNVGRVSMGEVDQYEVGVVDLLNVGSEGVVAEVQAKVGVDLSNVGREGSPIPTDWLKL